MLIDIDKIIVGDRIRKDFGDIQELADNIRKNGLLNPLTVNHSYKLLAGERRLRACKSLGWSQVDVRMVESDGEVQDLEIEMSENNVRRNFTGSELAEGLRRQMAIEAEKARERMIEGGGGGNISTPFGKARDAAGAAFGISGRQAEKVMYVADNRDLLDPADFADWDEGKLSTNKAYLKVKAAQQQAELERDAANRARDAANRALEDSERARAQKDAEIRSLRRQVAERPKPEVIEREVVREVVPADYESSKRRVADLKRDNERLSREYREMWQEKMEVDRKLKQANELLGESERQSNARRDIAQLTIATNNYLRQYGGKVWAFDQFDRVDKVTQDEFSKSIHSLAAFAQNVVQMIDDNNLRIRLNEHTS